MKDGFSDRAEVEVYPEGSAPRKGSAWVIRFVADCMQGTRWVFQQGPVSTSALLTQEYPGAGLGCKELVMGPALPPCEAALQGHLSPHLSVLGS